MPPALELREITKCFPGVVANDHVSLAVEAGEIRALVGENGAGKTTLMNILYGLEQPDDGEILIRGERCQFHSPLDAIRSGLGMVHQHFMLFPSLSVAENVVFGSEPTHGGILDQRAAQDAVASLAQDFGLQVDPKARVGSLPVGVRQRIEILKMLYRGAEILILDEPTAVLTPRERDSLFAVLRSLADSGKTVIFITHKLPEVLAFSDTATALRDGAVTGTVRTADSDEHEICRLMVGRDIELQVAKDPPVAEAEVVLSVRDLTLPTLGGLAAVRHLDLKIRAGEILGVAGAAGNGQTELVEAIAGLRSIETGEIKLLGSEVSNLSVEGRRESGQSHIPEERDEIGLALDASLTDNLLMGFENQSSYVRRGVLDTTTVRRHAESLLDEFSVKARSAVETAGTLSGGNRQKLVLAREMAHQARLLIAEQPTRGVDIGATEQIYELLVEYRDRGNAILLVSTDLTEILSLSDRIVVMFEGEIAGELSGVAATEEAVGILMGGGKA
jgi:simple sugar transport system ATP-binding protein